MFRFEITKGLPPEAKTIRRHVFMEEQGFQNEFDDHDAASWHIVAYDGDVPSATARAYEADGIYWIGRVAVEKKYRSRRVGAQLLQTLEEYITRLGAVEIHLDAQSRVVGFYQKLGYQICGEEHYDEFCPHKEMKKLLPES